VALRLEVPGTEDTTIELVVEWLAESVKVPNSVTVITLVIVSVVGGSVDTTTVVWPFVTCVCVCVAAGITETSTVSVVYVVAVSVFPGVAADDVGGGWTVLDDGLGEGIALREVELLVVETEVIWAKLDGVVELDSERVVVCSAVEMPVPDVVSVTTWPGLRLVKLHGPRFPPGHSVIVISAATVVVTEMGSVSGTVSELARL
jgi:hypothetical protein